MSEPTRLYRMELNDPEQGGELLLTDKNGNTYTVLNFGPNNAPQFASALGGYKFNLVETTDTNIQLNSDQNAAGVDTSGSAVTVTLPSASVNKGQIAVIFDTGGNGGTNNITVDTEGSETIDGATSAGITGDYGQLRVISNGTNWFTF